MNPFVPFGILLTIVGLIFFLALTGLGGLPVTRFGQALSVMTLTVLLVTSSGMGLNCELKKDKDKRNQNIVIYYGITIACGLILFFSIWALNHEVLVNTMKQTPNKLAAVRNTFLNAQRNASPGNGGTVSAKVLNGLNK